MRNGVIKRMLSTKVGVISVILITLLCVSVGATIFDYFLTHRTEVYVEGFEVEFDGQLMQNLNLSDSVSVASGHKTSVNHTIEFVAGDGDQIMINFTWIGGTDGLTTYVSYQGAPITTITISKGTVYPIMFNYEADAKIMSETVNVTCTVDITPL